MQIQTARHEPQAVSSAIASCHSLQEILGHADAGLTLTRYSYLIPSDSHAAAGKMAESLLGEETVSLCCPSASENASDQDAE